MINSLSFKFCFLMIGTYAIHSLRDTGIYEFPYIEEKNLIFNLYMVVSMFQFCFMERQCKSRDVLMVSNITFCMLSSLLPFLRQF